MNEKLTQRLFDIPRFSEQRRLLDFTSFTIAERNGVGRQLLKAILNRFGSMRECCESQSTLSKVFGVSRERVNRAIQTLSRLDMMTTDRRWNAIYKCVLNHYRVNWTELGRRIDFPTTTNVTFPPDQCDVSRRTNVTFPPDQCDVSRRTNVTFHADSNNSINLKETTTTELSDEWESVVVVLRDEFIMKEWPNAIAAAKRNGRSVASVQSDIAHYRESISQGCTVGHLFNWIRSRDGRPKTTTQLHSPKKSPTELARRRRESIRCDLSREWRALGIWLDKSDTEIETEIDRRFYITADLVGKPHNPRRANHG